MNASLKVAIAAEDGNGDQIIVLDGRADGVRERTAVANAGGTPIAHQVKVQFLKIRCQPCGEQVIGHHFRTGRKAGLDPRLDVQTALDSFLCQQASAQHKRGVRCVGAAGDGGNDHGAARKVKRVAVVSDGNVLGRRSFEDFSKRSLGLAPWSWIWEPSSPLSLAPSVRRIPSPCARPKPRSFWALIKRILGLARGDPILRTL